MRVTPFSYLEQKDVVVPPSAVLPQQSNILLHYEDANTNVSSTTWSDISALGVTTGTLQGATLLDSGSNSIQCGTSTSRTAAFVVTTSQNINIKSMVYIQNFWEDSIVSGAGREYFLDMRKSGTTNGGYFNQYDSVATGVNDLFGNDAEYSVYDESDGFLTSVKLTTPANLTNGTSNNTGGTGTDQWMGPNGRLTYLTKRLWHFNFNTNRDLGLTTSAARGLVFANNDNLSEGSNVGIFALVGWSVALTPSEVTQAVNYFKAQGVLS